MFFTGSRSGVMFQDAPLHSTRSALAPGAIRPRSSRPSARAPPRGAAAAHPRGRGRAVAAEHLVELDDRLGGVDLVGPPGLVGPALGLAEQLRGAGVDLGRREEAADEVPVGAVPALVELDGALEPLAPGRRVPTPLDALAVAGAPASGAEGQG